MAPRRDRKGGPDSTVQRLPGIHGLRAIAAIGIVFFHVAYVPTENSGAASLSSL
jgi:peptidoglycan/LPS O-acetylase OafA/YrhL